MFGTLAAISSLLISYAFLFSGNALLMTLLSLRAQQEGFPIILIGCISAAYFLGLYLGAKFSSIVVARSGHGRSYAVFAGYGAVCALLHALVVDPYSWIAIRLGTGFCIAGLLMVTESWINAQATRTTRGQVLSMYMITHYLAAGTGQLFIPFADASGFQLFSIAAIGYMLSLAPVLMTRLPAPEVKARQAFKFREIYGYSPTAMSGAFCCGLVYSAVYGLAPVYVQGLGMTPSTTAYFMALVIFSGGLLQWPIGRLSDHFDRRKLIATMCFASGLISVAIIFTAEANLIAFLICASLFGAFSFTVYPIALAYMNDSIDRTKLLYAAAGMLTAFSTGSIIGPVLGATAVDFLGFHFLFIYSATIMLLYAAHVIWRTRVKEAPKKKKFSRIFRVGESSTKSETSHQEVSDQTDKDMTRPIGPKKD